jgi:hypothetical protein
MLDAKRQFRDATEIHDRVLLLVRRADESAPPADGVRGECGDAHRHDRALGAREWADGRQELVRASAVDDAKDGVAALRQAQGPLATVLRLLVALDETAANETIDQAARRRGRSADRFGQLADGQGAAIGQDVEGGQLGEPEAELPELAGEPDDELAPERPAHGHSLADLADVREAIAGREDWRREVSFEPPCDRAGRGRASARPKDVMVVGHG